MDQNKRIAITGASGHLGTRIIIDLLDEGYFIKAQFHSFTPHISHPNLKWIKGDVSNIQDVTQLLTHCDVVIHSAGQISIGNTPEDVVFKTNVQGTQNVIDCCQLNDLKMVHISSSNAVKEGDPEEKFDEQRPYKTETDFCYPYTKAVGEKMVLKSVQNDNLKAHVFRPSSMVGPPDYKPSLMGNTIWDMNKGRFPLLTTGGYNIVDVRDVSKTIANSLKQPFNGEVYLLSGHYLTVKKLHQLSSTKRPPFAIPLSILIFLSPIIQWFNSIINSSLPITRESLETLRDAPKNMIFDKATKAFNHHPRPPYQTITDLVNWFQTNKK